MSPFMNMAINKEYGQTQTVAGIAWTIKQFTNKVIGDQCKERRENKMTHESIEYEKTFIRALGASKIV